MSVTNQYRETQNPLRDFLDEECRVGGEAYCQVADMKKAYASWCRMSGVKQINPHDFNRALESAGFRRATKKVGDVTVKAWLGVSVESPAKNETAF